MRLKMKENKICCGFVLFNPKSEDIDNIKPVSYTHLDVYKRQVGCISIRERYVW